MFSIEKKKNWKIWRKIWKIIYYVMRSKNEDLCASAGRLAAERSEADKPAKAHKTIGGVKAGR
jgi:hypothetical protein